MCSLTFVLLFLASSRELAYLLSHVPASDRPDLAATVAVLTYLSRNPLLLFFGILSAFTALALWAFYLHIALKYTHGVTFNEEDKYERVMDQLAQRLDDLQKTATSGDPAALRTAEEEVRRVAEWVRRFRLNYRSEWRGLRWLRLMFW